MNSNTCMVAKIPFFKSRLIDGSHLEGIHILLLLLKIQCSVPSLSTLHWSRLFEGKIKSVLFHPLTMKLLMVV